MTAHMLETLEKGLGEIKAQLQEDLTQRQDAATAEARKEFEDRIQAMEAKAADFEERLTVARKMHLSGVEVGDKPGQFSVGRMARALCGVSRWSDKELGLENEVRENMEKQGAIDALPDRAKATLLTLSQKSANTASDAAGHFLVPLEVQDGIIELLQSVEIAAALGANRMTGAVGDIAWNAYAGGLTAGYVDTEAGDASDTSSPTFRRIESQPRVATVAVDISWGMQNQTANVLDSWLNRQIARDLGLFEDKMFFTGSGSNKEPVGLLNMTGLTTATDFSGITYTGATQTLSDKLQDMIGQVEDANAGMGADSKLGWFGYTKVFRRIRQTKDGDGHSLFMAPNQGAFQQLLDFPLGKSTQLDSGTSNNQNFGFGDFNTSHFIQWGNMAFVATAEGRNNATKLQKTIVGVYAHDIVFEQPTAWNLATNFDDTP